MPPIRTKTSAGLETPDETVARAKALVAPAPIQPTVEAADLTKPSPMPPVTPVPQPGIPPRVDTTVNNVLGSIRSQSETARRLAEEQAAFQSFADTSSGFDIQNEQLERFGVTPEKLRELEDIQLQLADRKTASELTKVQIQGAAGQTVGQAQREVTQEDREAAVRDAGLAARAAVLQGNIETGRALAKDAVDIALADRTFQANAKLQEINDLKDVVDEETRQLLVAEERTYEAELARIKELKDNIATAMVNGASQAEISQLNDPAIDDATKLALAQSITARGATQMRNLDIQAKQANIAQSYASAAKSNTDRLLSLAEAGDPEAIAALGLTTNDGSIPTPDEIAYARQYAATGQIPSGFASTGLSFGRIQELAADLPKPPGALVNRDTGVAPTDIAATERTAYEALYNAVNTDLKVMQEAWKEAQGVTGTGIIGGITKSLLPNEAWTRYDTAKRDFLAKLIQARSGAAVTEQEYARYAALVPNQFNSPVGLGASGTRKLENLTNQVTSGLNDKLSSRGLSIYGYSTVKVGDQELVVGDVITNELGQTGRVNPDGSITLINQ